MLPKDSLANEGFESMLLARPRLAGLFIVLYLLGACAVNAQPGSSRTRYLFPSAVLIRGTDIETEPHNATQRLRDALEAVIAGRSPNPIPETEGTKLYLPDDVILLGAGRFRYNVLLVDAQLTTIRRKGGVCQLREMDGCARRILRGLGLPTP
jgi:hypothetical protein